MATGIVTGASRGLGLALTQALSARGWRLVVDARGAEALAAAVDGLEGVTAVTGDVTDEVWVVVVDRRGGGTGVAEHVAAHADGV